MIIQYVRYKINFSETQEFQAAYAEAVEILKKSPHCRSWELTRGLEDPDRFVMRIEWDSLDGHMKDFRVRPEYRVYFAPLTRFFEYIEEMGHYARTSVVGTAPEETKGSEE